MSIVKKFKSFFKKYKYSNNSSEWVKLPLNGITVAIQPHFKSNEYFDNYMESFISKIEKIKKKYYLVYNQIDVYNKALNHVNGENHRCIKFRVSDIPGNSEYGTEDYIPNDIKNEINSYIRKTLKMLLLMNLMIGDIFYIQYM